MTEKNFPKRKPNRLRNFKYDSIGVYFITICTKNKEKLFWQQVGASIAQHLKGSVTKAIGYSIWQKLFFDHIVRSRDEYDRINTYIKNNPLDWQNDDLYN